tara:strand:+ start:1127 stop:1861 length:735 start_codon:yes stop_codon:yes gene_type:complete
MAISVDTVYQRVLALANKEQRGYITPQEFNLLANQAQISIFESYFYSKNIRDRKEDERKIEVDETDIGELISQKLGPFQSVEIVTDGHTFPAIVPAGVEQCDVFQTGRVFYNNQVCQKIDINEAYWFARSIRHISTTAMQGPIYTDNLLTGRDILVYASSGTPIDAGVGVECFRVPVQASWAYVVVNEKALYNASVAVNFELHKAEEDTLVTRILELAGILINKPGLVQVASQKQGAEQQLQNI